MDQVPLFPSIKPAHRQRYDYALVGTFNADLRFFEQHVLPALRARRVLCLVDAGHYRHITHLADSQRAPRYAGIRYQVAPVSVSNGVFHSKFILWLSEKRARLILGSSNLTEAGYLSNAEIFTRIECETDQPDEASALVTEACDFLEGLTQGPYLDQPAKQFILDALKLRPGVSHPTNRQTWLIHSLDHPILDTVMAHLREHTVTEIHILAPFLGRDARLLDSLLVRFGHPGLCIYVQPERAQFEPEAMLQWHKDHPEARLFTISCSDTDKSTGRGGERYIHAKLLGFATSGGAYMLTGSPNFTNTALALSARQGNIETALLGHSPNASNAASLLSESHIHAYEVGSWADIKPGPESPWIGEGALPTLRIIEAHYAQSRLTLELDSRLVDATRLTSHKVFWCAPGGKPASSANVSHLATGRLAIECDLPTTAMLVWVEAVASTNNQTYISERHWVTFPQMPGSGTTAFGVDDFDACVEIGGLEGIREALKRASQEADDQPDWLIAFLQSWDLGLIVEPVHALVGGPKSITLTGHGSGKPLTTRPDILHKSLTVITQPEMETLLQDLVQHYRDQTAEWLGDDDPEHIWVGLQYATVFNWLCLLLMFGYKENILIERAKKAGGKTYPEMKYGHVRVEAHRFVDDYGFDWEKHFQSGNHAIGRIPERKSGASGHLALFHYTEMALAYTFLQQVAPQLDLEAPTKFKPLAKAMMGGHREIAREKAREWLASPEGDGVLDDVVAYYSLVMQICKVIASASQIRVDVTRLTKVE